jgi:phosphopantetheinyl transferase
VAALSRSVPQVPHYWLRPLLEGGVPAAQLTAQERDWCGQLPPARRIRYGGSRRWLRHQLAELLGMPAAAVPLHSPPGAPPRLGEGLGHLSLSHSGAQVLLAWSPAPIGVDLEWAQRPLRAASLARRFFPAEEAERLLALPVSAQRAALLESWVRKEAAIKWQGSSLARDLRHWCWDAARAELRHLDQGWRPASLCRWRDGWLCGAVGEAVEQGIWG